MPVPERPFYIYSAVSVKGFRKWLIFYRPTSANIEVVRILSSYRDWETIFR